jgi:hypothetical protein
VILNREEIADDTKHFHSVYMRIKILTEAGRRFADIRVPFDRHNFTIDTVSGRTVHADGSIVPFEGKPFEQVINKGHDVRHLLKTFTLPDVQVGSIIEYRYYLRYGDRIAVSPFWVVPAFANGARDTRLIFTVCHAERSEASLPPQGWWRYRDSSLRSE